MNIIIVEDDPTTRELLKQSLRFLNYNVMAASNGCEALALLEEYGCRLVISDWVMPEMDGLELIRQIRQRHDDGYVYVIMLTSKDTTENIIEGYTCGVDDFMTKPFEPAELTARLRTARRILALETRDVTIFALAKLAESRDTDTGEHLERTREYSRSLARDLADHRQFIDEITPEFIALMYKTSPLHDIGKVSIPDHVLLKPGRLDDGEFDIMKTHARRGALTLEKALEKFPDATFLRMACDIARHHHEKYDGSGYPDGLAGEAIPLAARIFALADVYDALVSKRVYKNAFGHDVAKKIIVKDSGSHFDPKVVQAFLRCDELFHRISQSHRKAGSAEPVLQDT